MLSVTALSITIENYDTQNDIIECHVEHNNKNASQHIGTQHYNKNFHAKCNCSYNYDAQHNIKEYNTKHNKNCDIQHNDSQKCNTQYNTL